MRFQLGIQIMLIVIAAAITFGVIKPKFEDIRVDQNQIVSYREAIENMGRYNQRLQSLLNEYNSLPQSDREALLRYLPESIDVAAVSRDIGNIVEINNLLLIDITFDEVKEITTTLGSTDDSVVVVDPYMTETYDAGVDPAAGVTNTPLPGLLAQTFEVSVVGTYEQMKEMLKDFEQNNYPLRLIEFSFAPEDSSSGLIQYAFTLETYALPAS